ncbi:MAG: hypothetical protein SFW64_07880 [Alphaproteobacteria bacterium]|nr:hypothetical protein [Alphaproteobacteria bacterium]
MIAAPPRTYATLRHPTIEALVGGHYRYRELSAARARFDSITAHFICSKDLPEPPAEIAAALLWIKGFAVGESEAQAGYTGHFARMDIIRRPDGLFTLTARKLERPLATHPQRKRAAGKHPNMGHPVMRAIKKRKIYASIEAAQAELDLLHLDFPEVSIPGAGRLYIILYEKRAGSTRPTHKIAIEIEPHPQGGYLLAMRDNEKPAPASASPSAPPPGAFTAKVLLRQKKKRKNLGRPVTGHTPEEQA